MGSDGGRTRLSLTSERVRPTRKNVAGSVQLRLTWERGRPARKNMAGSMQLRLTWERGRPARKNLMWVRLAQHELEGCKLAA